MDIVYKYYDCSKEIIGNPDKIDGKKCPECNGRLIPMYYIGIDLAKGRDMTGYPPGVSITNLQELPTPTGPLCK